MVVRHPRQCHIIVKKCSPVLDSSSVIYTVLRKLLLSVSTVQTEADNSTTTSSTSVVDSVVKAVQYRLDSASSSSHSETAAGTPLTLCDIRSVSGVCSTLSDCLPDTFTEYFIQQASKHLDDMQLFKVSST